MDRAKADVIQKRAMVDTQSRAHRDEGARERYYQLRLLVGVLERLDEIENLVKEKHHG